VGINFYLEKMKIKKLLLILISLFPAAALACVNSTGEDIARPILSWLVIIFGPLSFLSFIITSIFLLTFKKYSGNKKLEWYQRFSAVIFIISILVYFFISSISNSLCASGNF